MYIQRNQHDLVSQLRSKLIIFSNPADFESKSTKNKAAKEVMPGEVWRKRVVFFFYPPSHSLKEWRQAPYLCWLFHSSTNKVGLRFASCILGSLRFIEISKFSNGLNYILGPKYFSNRFPMIHLSKSQIEEVKKKGGTSNFQVFPCLEFSA